MVYNCIIGIDPGMSGGLSVVTTENLTPRLYDMPRSVNELRAVLDNYVKFKPVVFLEKVSFWIGDLKARPGMTEKEKGAMRGKVIRMQKLTANYESLKTAIQWQGYDLVECTPMQWQRGLALKSIKDRTERKNRNKDHAKYFYPGLKITHKTADAVLIMQYGLSKINGGIIKKDPPKPPKQGLLF